ncbi:hypothetical protein L2E82_32730 [Cichorium intybus]|uniref:Uncharacterized protein n=1 Tax=Cichorium intybus TaxID=13427 RepID=A0ACB9BH64_CICIN|nr:hypothetical protein L2E82_32730 [Cichorium intybus]
MWGEVIITDMCKDNNGDWTSGTILILTDTLDYICESIEVSVGNKVFRVRVREVDEKVFHQRGEEIYEEEMKIEEENDDTEKESSSEISEFDSSEGFSDEEDVESAEDTVIPESNHEETKVESAHSNSKELPKDQINIEDVNCKNNNKEEKEEKIVELSPFRNNQNSLINKSPKKKKVSSPFVEPTENNPEGKSKLDNEIKDGVGSPLLHLGLSDKLVKLLSRQTPIKEKLEEMEVEKKKEEKTKENRNKSQVSDRSQMELRITRSQTRKEIRRSSRQGKRPIRFVPDTESIMSHSISSRLEEIGESCGIKKKKEGQKLQKKGNKAGDDNGKP